MSVGKLLAAILAGVAAGAVLGILFAPEKGSKIRKRILNKGERSAEELKGSYDDFYESIAEKFETPKPKSTEILSPKRKPNNQANKGITQPPSVQY
jgi:gas vesicle protein